MISVFQIFYLEYKCLTMTSLRLLLRGHFLSLLIALVCVLAHLSYAVIIIL